MDQLHALLAWLAAAAAIGLLAAALLTAMTRTGSYRLLDRAILVQIGTAAAASASGLLFLPSGRVPGDPLHFVYAVVAVAASPATRYVSRQGDARRIGRWQVVGGVIVLGALLRSFMTGG